MEKRPLYRLIGSPLLILLGFVVPWFFLFPAGVILIAYSGWNELIILGLVMDFMYGKGVVGTIHVGFLWTSVFLLAMLARPYIRRYFFTPL